MTDASPSAVPQIPTEAQPEAEVIVDKTSDDASSSSSSSSGEIKAVAEAKASAKEDTTDTPMDVETKEEDEDEKSTNDDAPPTSTSTSSRGRTVKAVANYSDESQVKPDKVDFEVPIGLGIEVGQIPQILENIDKTTISEVGSILPIIHSLLYQRSAKPLSIKKHIRKWSGLALAAEDEGYAEVKDKMVVRLNKVDRPFVVKIMDLFDIDRSKVTGGVTKPDLIDRCIDWLVKPDEDKTVEGMKKSAGKKTRIDQKVVKAKKVVKKKAEVKSKAKASPKKSATKKPVKKTKKKAESAGEESEDEEEPEDEAVSEAEDEAPSPKKSSKKSPKSSTTKALPSAKALTSWIKLYVEVVDRDSITVNEALKACEAKFGMDLKAMKVQFKEILIKLI